MGLIMEICCFAGHRPQDFPWEYGSNHPAHALYINELRRAVSVAVDFDDITTFYCGMEHGADLDFAEAVLYERDTKYPHIQLVCILPCPNCGVGWNKEDVDRYNAILEKSNGIEILSDKPSKDYAATLRSFLIEHSGRIIAFWDGKYSGEMWEIIRYAIEQGNYTWFIRSNEIKEDAEDVDGSLAVARKLREAEEAEKRSFWYRISSGFIVQELIKQHPNPKGAFQAVLDEHPYLALHISNIASIAEIELDEDKE